MKYTQQAKLKARSSCNVSLYSRTTPGVHTPINTEEHKVFETLSSKSATKL